MQSQPQGQTQPGQMQPQGQPSHTGRPNEPNPRRSGGRRKLGIALVIVLSVALLIAVNIARKAAGTPPVPVDLLAAERAEFQVSIVANGIIHAGDRHEVAATSGGLVAAVHVAEGDRVQAGDPLLTLRTTELERAVERATLQVQQAEARVATAEQIGEAPRTIDAERQNLALARLALADAEQALADAVIRSPADGIVIRLVPKAGQAVGMGSPVAVVGLLDRLEVEAHVDEVDVAAIAPGNEATVTSAGLPHMTFSGEVRKVALEAAPGQSGVATFPVAIDLANTDGMLRPGMNVQVEIVTATRPDAITVPLISLHERDGETFVWVARNGEAVEVPVTVGLRSQSAAEITGGLELDELVITGPSTALRDMTAGTRVTGRGRSAGPASGFRLEVR